MDPQYSKLKAFSEISGMLWGKFVPKKIFLRNEEEIERQWSRKESWNNIRLAIDNVGATIAYESSSKRKGF